MRLNIKVTVLVIVLISLGFRQSPEITDEKNSESDLALKMADMHIPFIINKGQIDKSVEFYAQIFSGTVYVTGTGDIVYAIPGPAGSYRSGNISSKDRSPTGLALKEKFIGSQVKDIKGFGRSDTRNQNQQKAINLPHFITT